MSSKFSVISNIVASALPSRSKSTRKGVAKAKRRRICYLVYGFLVFLIVFSGNYFSVKIEPLIRAEIQKQKNYDIQIGVVDPILFPPSITLSHIKVKDPKDGKELLHMDRLHAELDLINLLKSRLALKFEVSSYGTNVKGFAGTGLFFNYKKFNTDVNVVNISLDNIPMIKELNIGLAGEGESTLQAEGTISDPSSYEGQIDVSLNKLSFNGPKPLFQVAKVEAESLDGTANLKNLVFNIAKIELKGKDLSGNIIGKIAIDPNNFNNSILDLKGQVTAALELFDQRVIIQKNAITLMKAKKPIPVKISDTVGKPWVSLEEAPD